MLVIYTLVPISKANSSRELFSPYLNSYHNNSKHPLIIVPTKLPRTENLLAEFARFSTHNHNRTVITRSHVWKLMYHTDMTLCACGIFGVRVEDINIRRENVWHIVNKTSVQAPTIAGLIQLACLASHDSLHLRTHLQPSASVLLAAVPLNMWRDRICLLTHDVQAIVLIDLPFSYPTKDTPLICIFLCNQKR